ncbi:MAG: hypothetical protein H0X34_05170 [Chthoniobacterales bacterium]|nr:hypothetical protein [Chthoniobacterales bacterium]
MSDFLGNLVARSLATSPAVRPQLVSIFEPPPLNGGVLFQGEDAGLPVIEQHDEERGARISELRALWQTTPQPVAPLDTALSAFGLTSAALPDTPERSQLDPPRAPPIQSSSHSTPAIGLNSALTKGQPNEQSASPRPVPPNQTPQAAGESSVRHNSAEERSLQLPERKVIETIDRGAKAGGQVAPARAVESRPPQRFSATPLVMAEKAKASSVGPSIKVTIGRVEVRAVLPSVAAPKPASPSAPKLSLEEYLKARNRTSA